MNPRCTHLAVRTRDVDRSVGFYKRYAALVEVHRRSDGKVTVVWLGEKGREHEFVIVLIGIAHEDVVEPGPMAHIGYAVDSRDEVEKKARMGTEDGLLAEGPTDAGPIVGYYCIVNDPDGNKVEFSYGQSLGPAD